MQLFAQIRLAARRAKLKSNDFCYRLSALHVFVFHSVKNLS